MSTLTNYQKGYAKTLKTAGFGLEGPRENTYASGGAVSGMLAGSALGGQLGDSLSKKTRKKVLGLSIPGTESVDPGTAHTLGSVLGALGGGYLGHQYGTASGRSMDLLPAQAAFQQ